LLSLNGGLARVTGSALFAADALLDEALASGDPRHRDAAYQFVLRRFPAGDRRAFAAKGCAGVDILAYRRQARP
jgi:hypothetical protein